MSSRQRNLTSFIVFAALAVAAFLAVSSPLSGSYQRSERIQRGQYLVTVGGCNDCHTPWKMGPKGPEPDMTRMLSGHPESFPMGDAPKLPPGPWIWSGGATNTSFAGPWGVSYARNLTPEKLTGTGIWTFEIFKNTIRNGRHWGVGRPLNPPMPWFNYREMTDEDLAAVFAYLRTLKPIRNEVPQPLPPQQASK